MDNIDLKSLYDDLTRLRGASKKEYLIVTYKGSIPTIDITYIDYLEKCGVDLGPITYRSMHPAIIFIALAAPTDILKSSEEIFPGKLKYKCDITKIHSDDYAIDVEYDNGKTTSLNKEFRIPTNIKSFDEFVVNFNKYKLPNILSRHPHLKRLIKKYCAVNDIYFNDTQLKDSLHHIAATDIRYSYYDADEYVLFVEPDGTYFELLPYELKIQIVSIIEEQIESSKVHGELLTRMIASIIHGRYNVDGSSIGDIYEDLKDQGYVEEIKGNGSNIVEFLDKMGGPMNLLTSLVSTAVNNISSETET